jgi:transposase
MARKPYPSDVSDDEWALIFPYLTLMTEESPPREYSLREVFNGLRWIVRAEAAWRRMPHDLPPWPTVYQQGQRWLTAGVLFDALGQDLRPVLRLAQGRTAEPSAAICDSRTLPSTPKVDQGYTGAHAAEEAQAQHMRLEVVKLPEAKKGFVLLSRRRVMECSNAWAARFRRLARDDERLAETLAGLHVVAFALLMLQRCVDTFKCITRSRGANNS